MYTTMYIDFVPTMPNISTVQGLSGGKTGGDETMVSSVKRGGLLLFKYLNGVFGILEKILGKITWLRHVHMSLGVDQ